MRASFHWALLSGTIVPTDKLRLVTPWIIAAALIVAVGMSLAIGKNFYSWREPPSMVLGYLLLYHLCQIEAVNLAYTRKLGNQHNKYDQTCSQDIGAG